MDFWTNLASVPIGLATLAVVYLLGRHLIRHWREDQAAERQQREKHDRRRTRAIRRGFERVTARIDLLLERRPGGPERNGPGRLYEPEPDPEPTPPAAA